jgi:hypothetical protein
MGTWNVLAALLVLACVMAGGCTESDQILGTVELAACDGNAARIADIDRDHCVQDAAIRMGDVELCREIAYAPPRTKCVMLIAEKAGDATVCEQMENHPGSGEYSRLECLQRVAAKTGDASVCDTIGTDSVSYMFTGRITKETCIDAAGGPESEQSLAEIYDQNKDKYAYCQDLAYTEVFGHAPEVSGGSKKSDVGAKLESDYTLVYEGSVAAGSTPQVSLRDGDILVFGFSTAPDPSNAPHYAVAEGGNVLQVRTFRIPGNRKTGRDAGPAPRSLLFLHHPDSHESLFRRDDHLSAGLPALPDIPEERLIARMVSGIMGAIQFHGPNLSYYYWFLRTYS